ncbi:MAG: hypothetical protein ACR2PX_15155 [Endozoicomonas sp.]|uniref:hypothetical protein n=1 Tax=Endozoicomonas sp. TaxID=1892382 RepID=UPI003D9B99FD
MKIYELTFDVDKYQMLVPVDDRDYDGSYLWVNGQLKLSSWLAPAMRWTEKEHSGESIPDIARINPGFFAFSNKAVGITGTILSEFGELLELPVDGKLFLAFNPTVIVDCLNVEQSGWRINRRGERGRLLSPVLNQAKLNGIKLFQISDRHSSLYASDEFFELVIKNGLTGLTFTPVKLAS